MQVILALLMGIFVGGVAGYVGSLMLTRRMSLVAGPLGEYCLFG
jgi:ABC-type Mn2+/Zn2+ transport system permease subunit